MDEPVDVPALAPLVEVIGTEVFIEGSALQHFIGGGEDRSGDGANGSLGTAAGAQAMELRLEVTGLFAGGGRSALDKGGFEPGGTPRFREGRLLRIRVERRLPALSLLRGHRPAQRSGARRLESGSCRGRFRQEPARRRPGMTQALNWSTPGRVLSGSTVGRKGSATVRERGS